MSTPLRRIAVGLLSLPLLLGATACGSDGFEEGGDEGNAAGGGETVTIVGQKFTEADIMTQLYKLVLEDAGYSTEVKNLGARDIYLAPLEKGEVQVSADYLSSLTEALNRRANGEDAAPVASPDADATVEELKKLGEQYGITALDPAEAEDANAYAVTEAFAEENDLETLSDLGALGQPIALAAAPDCADRPDCGKGLTSVYGIELSKVEPLGFGTPDTKKALADDEVQLGQVGTSDGSLEGLGLVVLEDDKDWQNAENLVPVVNSAWLADNPEAGEALDKLSAELDTDDLTEMNGKVDGERQQAEDVAREFLQDAGLI